MWYNRVMKKEDVEKVLEALRESQYWNDYSGWAGPWDSECHDCCEVKGSPCDDDCKIDAAIKLLEKELAR